MVRSVGAASGFVTEHVAGPRVVVLARGGPDLVQRAPFEPVQWRAVGLRVGVGAVVEQEPARARAAPRGRVVQRGAALDAGRLDRDARAEQPRDDLVATRARPARKLLLVGPGER